MVARFKQARPRKRKPINFWKYLVAVLTLVTAWGAGLYLGHRSAVYYIGDSENAEIVACQRRGHTLLCLDPQVLPESTEGSSL